MKKIIIILFFLLIFSGSVYAQTLTPSPAQSLITPTKSQEQIDTETLKEKVASKVAELREKNNKAVSGYISEKSDSQVKIKRAGNEEYLVRIDKDLTKFYQIAGTQKKEVNYATFKKDSYILVEGVINEKEVDANALYLDEEFFVASGMVTEVNSDEFYIRVAGNDKENYTLDVETFTKEDMVNIKTLALEKIAFSKIKEGDTIHFIAKQGLEKEPNRFPAQRILIIPQEYFIK